MRNELTGKEVERETKNRTIEAASGRAHLNLALRVALQAYLKDARHTDRTKRPTPGVLLVKRKFDGRQDAVDVAVQPLLLAKVADLQ
jgi:hypothetical protein